MNTLHGKDKHAVLRPQWDMTYCSRGLVGDRHTTIPPMSFIPLVLILPSPVFLTLCHKEFRIEKEAWAVVMAPRKSFG